MRHEVKELVNSGALTRVIDDEGSINVLSRMVKVHSLYEWRHHREVMPHDRPVMCLTLSRPHAQFHVPNVWKEKKFHPSDNETGAPEPRFIANNCPVYHLANGLLANNYSKQVEDYCY